jgi:hypothetical protein
MWRCRKMLAQYGQNDAQMKISTEFCTVKNDQMLTYKEVAEVSQF